MEVLGRYKKTTKLTNKNAGSCKWCFASRDGKEFFIKEFLGPKYPENDTTSTPEKKEKKIKKCKEFEDKKSKIYRTINEHSDGNAVRIEDFFRVGSRYYMAMPKVNSNKVDIDDIANFHNDKKRKVCAVIAHAVSRLHAGRFVHADIKHSNIMFTHAKSGALTAKVIDYDAGFFEGEPPTHPEELAGDQVYFSPEGWKVMCGEEATLTCKMDVFALGVLFHQYMTGKLPDYDEEKYSCVGEAVAAEDTIKVSFDLPLDILRLLCQMLSKNPEARPTAWEVYSILIKPFKPVSVPEPEPEPPQDNIFIGDALGRTGWQDMGDLW